MALTPGTRLGPYEVLSALGAGGMGEVYRARDPRLARDVAVKVLPVGFSADPERLERFEQEARAAAALNHPNILAVYDIGRYEGAPYIVSELLEGQTLRELVSGGALPVKKAVEYGIQICEGLASAHAKGIVHRDLKPENLFVMVDGRLKILDFGLAKLLEAAPAALTMSTIPTRPAASTPGLVLGTVGYMSPEQVRGQAVDHRSDVFSFGAVLYEMLSGTRAFSGETAADTMTAILRGQPKDLSTGSDRQISLPLASTVERCLEKVPASRFQSASDLSFALKAVGSSSAIMSTVGSSPSAPARHWLVSLATGVAGLLVGAGVILTRVGPAEPQHARIGFSFTAEPGTTSSFLSNASGLIPEMALSPDGRQVLFGAMNPDGTNRLWVRAVSDLEAKPVPGTEEPLDNGSPFWSPDGTQIGWVSNGKLRVRAVGGGGTTTLCESGGFRGAAWAKDGTIVFASYRLGLVKVRVNAPGECQRLDGFPTTASYPVLLDDNAHILFTSPEATREVEAGIYVSTRDGRDRKRLLSDKSRAAVANNQIFFVRKRALVSQQFDVQHLVVTGEPHSLASPMLLNTWQAGAFDVSGSGVLAYANGVPDAMSLRWFDRAGRPLGDFAGPGQFLNAALSPDGSAVAADRYDPETSKRDIWVYRSGMSPTRLTFGLGDNSDAVWSVDGKRVYFGSTREGGGLYEKPVAGDAVEQLVTPTGVITFPRTISWDGRYLVYQTPSIAGHGWDLWAVSLIDSDHKPFPAFATAWDEMHAQFAPGRNLIAYVSNETGTYEVYVSQFPPDGVKWQVSNGGGRYPRWRRDGRELFFIRADGTLAAVDVHTEQAGFIVAEPKTLFPTGIFGLVGGRPRYSPSVDGQKFLMSVTPGRLIPITVVINGTMDDRQR